jgi:5-methyltetrahydropteroyltriglutamate--homocysteine methyltransferase
MIGCYLTGIHPRPDKLIEITRAYERKKVDENELEKSFRKATQEIINAQVVAEFDYITDGMLKWQDLPRPFTEGLSGIRTGSLARWFNNNTFYRKPVIVNTIKRTKDIVKDTTYLEQLPKSRPWKAVLPAPYTFVSISENRFYRDETELMFKFAQILNEEIRSLAGKGFSYIQLSDPALVYRPTTTLPAKKDTLTLVNDALEVAVRRTPVKTCLQAFFGDFSGILPEALDFPVDHLGIDLYETNLGELKEYNFEKGIALGLIDSRSSLVEYQNELIAIAKEAIESLYPSKIGEVFICPNCDLEFLPWKRAEEKMEILSNVAQKLGEEFHD